MVWPKRLKQNIEPETFMLRDATTSCQFLVTPLSCARTSQRRCPVQHSMVACIQQSPTASLLTLIIPDTTSQKVTNPHLSLCSSLIPSTLMRPQFRVGTSAYTSFHPRVCTNTSRLPLGIAHAQAPRRYAARARGFWVSIRQVWMCNRKHVDKRAKRYKRSVKGMTECWRSSRSI